MPPDVPPSSRPRVVIVPEWYPSTARPVLGAFVREQAHAVARSADVLVAYADPDLEPKRGLWSFEHERDGDVRVVRVGVRSVRPRQIGTVLRIAALQAALREAAFEPDVVHAHVFSAAVPALWIGRRSGAPVVVTEHYTGVARRILSRWDRAVARLAYSRADLVCPVSRDLAEAVSELAGGARIEVVPNSVDADVFAPTDSATSPDGAKLIAVGGLTEAKGIRYLIEAMPRLDTKAGEIELDIVGDGPERPSLEELSHRLGVEDRVAFHGTQPKPRVAELMRDADLFVLPSLWENLPCVVIEALASGLPVVASDVGGVDELVDSSRGALVPSRDPAALAEAIQETLVRFEGHDPHELAHWAADRFGFSATGGRWLEVYDEVRR